jgi:NADH-quinone oxidoreductase subunit C
MDERIADVLARARERFGGLGEPVTEHGEHAIEVPRALLAGLAPFLRDEAPFELLADWSATDLLEVEPPERRFLLTAHLASATHPGRLRLRVRIPQGDETCPSLTGVWPGANFQEREIYDFFGVAFEGHPGLRRIFMPDEWEGHPQRKDYPLGGTNVEYHGAFIPPPDLREDIARTSGYPGRHA